jgi:hypothetical protein
LLTFLLLIVNSLLQKQKKQKPNYEKVINANTLYITDKEFSDRIVIPVSGVARRKLGSQGFHIVLTNITRKACG